MANKNAGKRRQGSGVFVLTVFVVIAAALVGAAYQTHGKLPKYPPGPRAATKPYKSFTDFYPYYKTEHRDPTNRFLHILSLVVVALYFVWQPRMVISTVIAIAAGYMATDVFQAVPHGYFEFGLMIALFVVSNLALTGKTGITAVVLGYAVSLIGHMYFEGHFPKAITNYPAFALMGDFYQAYETAIGKEKFIMPSIPGFNA